MWEHFWLNRGIHYNLWTPYQQKKIFQLEISKKLQELVLSFTHCSLEVLKNFFQAWFKIFHWKNDPVVLFEVEAVGRDPEMVWGSIFQYPRYIKNYMRWIFWHLDRIMRQGEWFFAFLPVFAQNSWI